MDKASMATLDGQGSRLDTDVLGKESKAPSSRVETHYIVDRRWIGRFVDQFSALSYKNFIVAWRSFRATLLRLLSPLFFMFLLWIMNIAVRSDNPYLSFFVDNPDPDVTLIGPIPACTENMYASTPCWDFLYTPNNDSTINALVQAICENNPGRPIPADAVMGFPTLDATNAWLSNHSEQTLGAYHFSLNGTTGINYLLQVNSTIRLFAGNYQDPTFFSQVPLQVAADREIARLLWTQAGRDPAAFSYNMSVSQYAHPTTNSINIVGQAIGPFVFAANLFSFVLVLANIVVEKESGLRQALTNVGMMDSSFWLSWGFTEMVAGVLFSLLIIAFGAAFQFAFFLKNSFGILFLLFFLFQWAMTSVAFIFSTFIARSSNAVYVGFVIFIIGWICQVIIAFGFPYTPSEVHSVPALTVIFALLPWCLLAKASNDLGAASTAAGTQGISWSNRNDYCQDIQNPTEQAAAYVPGVYQDFDCVLSVQRVLIFLTLEAIVYFVIALYLDNILANNHGVRKQPWYFLQPSYWMHSRSKGIPANFDGQRATRWPFGRWRTAPVQPTEPSVLNGAAAPTQDPDVAQEEQRMKDLLEHRRGVANGLAAEAYPLSAVEVFGLKKVFRPTFWMRIGNKLRRKARQGHDEAHQQRIRDFWAIKDSWFSIDQDKVFCLLGPNGAGKTTTINCLTGVFPPTAGEALICGERLASAGGLDRIRSVMGVCPQFDVLWAELTGAEHLFIYGRVKGLTRQEVRRQGNSLLEAVKLTSASRVRSGAYSGGMRRRLSVAIALLGDPLIVYLDEPTTGMDPISRRHVWDVIEAAKPGRAIVLTTHSMEEADVLGDTVAIMARGRVRAFGTSLRLKQRFGSGYQLTVSAPGGRGPTAAAAVSGEPAGPGIPPAGDRFAAVKAYFISTLGIRPTEENKAYVQFQVPKAHESQLPQVLTVLRDKAVELGVSDVQVSLTSLEEVFLTIARKAELEVAEAEGRATTKFTLEDGTVLNIPLGDDSVEDGQGRVFGVVWAQDEQGRLQVLRCDLVEKTGSSESTSEAASRPTVDGVQGLRQRA